MKLWEVMRLLDENPAKVFEADMYGGHTARMRVDEGFGGFGGYYRFEIFDGKRLIHQSLGGGSFNGNAALRLNWHEVKELVTWQKAIQEFAKGKKVLVTFNNQEFSFEELVELPNYLDRAISIGKWYVQN